MSGLGADGSGFSGQAGVSSATSDFAKQFFLIKQSLGFIRTATLVQVMGCTNDDAVSPVGFVDVMPLVNLMDGIGISSPHGTVFNLPYCRLQGGKNAVIADPVKGDLGVAVFADRDISSVKATRKQANPGSRRRFDFADGIYLFGVLNAAPTQYVQFTQDGDGNPTGINVVDVNGNVVNMTANGTTITDKNTNKIEMVSAGIKVNGVLFDRSQNISNVDTVKASGEGTFSGSHTVSAHTHTSESPGSPTSGPTG